MVIIKTIIRNSDSTEFSLGNMVISIYTGRRGSIDEFQQVADDFGVYIVSDNKLDRHYLSITELEKIDEICMK